MTGEELSQGQAAQVNRLVLSVWLGAIYRRTHMATVYTEMLSALLADHLETELAELDGENNGGGTFFASASRVLNDKDMIKFVATVRRKAVALRKQAHGCPSRVWDWREHYSA